jgi:hypothetical protein
MNHMYHFTDKIYLAFTSALINLLVILPMTIRFYQNFPAHFRAYY